MPAPLDRALVLQTLAGYAEVNRITAAERCQRLQTVTDREALETFAALYETWKRSGALAGGDREALARRKLEYKIRLRQAFETLARAKGLL
ncbi:MAG: hypothetical protein HY784_08200 [Chloroflexi bacterium]|nr:hypothetical protein [Chloroflexota bacterium]